MISWWLNRKHSDTETLESYNLQHVLANTTCSQIISCHKVDFMSERHIMTRVLLPIGNKPVEDLQHGWSSACAVSANETSIVWVGRA